MRDHQPISNCLIIWFCALLAGATAAQADDWVPAERRLPPNVVHFRSIRHLPELLRKSADSATGRRQVDPEFVRWSKATSKGQSSQSILYQYVNSVWKVAEEHYGIRPEMLFDAVAGEITVARTDRGELVWFLEIGADAREFAEQKEWLVPWLCDGSNIVSSKVISETNCTTIIPSKGRESTHLKELSFFARDSYLVLATSADLLPSILERWNGAHASTLAADPTFQAVARQAEMNLEDRAARFLWYTRDIPGGEKIFDDHMLGEVLFRSIDVGCTLSLNHCDEENRAIRSQLAPNYDRNAEIAIGGQAAFLTRGVDIFRKSAGIRINPENPALKQGEAANPVFKSTAQSGGPRRRFVSSDDEEDAAIIDPAPEILSRASLPAPPVWLRDDTRRVYSFRWNIQGLARLKNPAEWLTNGFTKREAVEAFHHVVEFARENEIVGWDEALTGNAWLVDLQSPGEQFDSTTVLGLEISGEQAMRRILKQLETAKLAWKSDDIPNLWSVTYDDGYNAQLEPITRIRSLLIAHGYLFVAETSGTVSRIAKGDSKAAPLADDPEFKAVMARLPKSCRAFEFEIGSSRKDSLETDPSALPRNLPPLGAEGTSLEYDGDFVVRTSFQLRAKN